MSCQYIHAGGWYSIKKGWKDEIQRKVTGNPERFRYRAKRTCGPSKNHPTAIQPIRNGKTVHARRLPPRTLSTFGGIIRLSFRAPKGATMAPVGAKKPPLWGAAFLIFYGSFVGIAHETKPKLFPWEKFGFCLLFDLLLLTPFSPYLICCRFIK